MAPRGTGESVPPHEIRDAVAADPAAVAGVHVASWQATYGHLPAAGRPPEGMADHRTAVWAARIRRSDATAQVLVGQHGDGLAGFVWFGPTTDGDDDPRWVGSVRSLHVDPRLRGRGWGKALLVAALERLARCGRPDASLWVVADNDGARAFYEAQGWRPDGTHRRETLALPGEAGPVVEVRRYRVSRRDRSDDRGRRRASERMDRAG